MAESCTSCGRSRGTGRFCENCGAPLPRSCPSCAAVVSADAGFCGGCGQRLEEGPARATGEGERRQLAVLFCDIVDSTPLARQMDIEEFGELMLEVQQLATAVINAYGGTVHDYAGDGFVAWFGWPTAHEDDTALAVHAGLEILEKLLEVNTRIENAGGARIALRVGIHVGLAVLRTDRADRPAFGETFHVAARLQSYAEPDTVVVSELANQLIRRRFQTALVGRPELKGLGRSLEVYRVEGPLVASEQLPQAQFTAPLVGRERELAQLHSLWTSTKRGSGRTALISGEPGVGKSRLLRTLKDCLAAEPHLWLEIRCAPLWINSAFRPVADMVRVALGIRASDSGDEQRRKIESALPAPQSGLVAGLIGIESDELPPPERFRSELMTTLSQWLVRLAREVPIVLAGEDLHWSDPSTLELVRALQGGVANAPVLIVLTKRSEATIELASEIELALDRLDLDHTRTLARHLTSGQSVAPELVEQLVERSDGVPLFLEELVAAVDDVGSGATALPPSLHSLLLARLDHLGEGREVAQIASVIGRDFPEELLAAAADVPPARLADAMRKLGAARLIERGRSVDGPRYHFRHALICDAAYASLLKPRRIELHRHVARVLEQQFPQRASRNPGVLGHHFALGEQPLDAARWFERAGLQAASSAALAEATAHYQRGIELLGAVPPSDERDRREMWLRILLGNALMGSEGHGADVLRPVWRRAIELGERVGDADELTAALNGLAVQEADNGDLAAASALAQRQIDIAHETGSRFARLRGEGTLGLALFYSGRGREALDHFQASLACYRRGDFQTVTFGVGHDQGIFARAMSAWTLWWLGVPDAAVDGIEETVNQAEQLGSFLSLAMARHFRAMIHQLRRERELALEQAQRNVEFAHELGFRFWEGVALLGAGAERAHAGEPDGLADIARGLGLLSEARSHSGTSSGFAMIAEAHHAAGDTTAALGITEAGLKLSRDYRQPFWDAELMRLKAEFMLALDPGVDLQAETLMREALLDARQRGSAALALRAASSLARQLSARGRTAEARAELVAALAAIEGGEHTADIRDARALLDQLSMDTLRAKELQ